MTTLLSTIPAQNPDPTTDRGQDYTTKKQELTAAALMEFRKRLPSNYVASVTGPAYMMQFQAVCEQLAEIQMAATQVFGDSDYSVIRSEYLWETLGTLVFPDSRSMPIMQGDATYRAFLQTMVTLLLQGSTPSSVLSGVEAVADTSATLIERFKNSGTSWTTLDTFTFDVELSGLPVDTGQVLQNLPSVIDALRPAHTLGNAAFVITETANPVSTVEMTQLDLDDWRYEDARRNIYGAKQISGASGVMRGGRHLHDTSRDFSRVRVGARLTLLSGPDAGRSGVVTATSSGLVDTGPIAHAYSTSPSGLTGTATVNAGVVVDSAQDFAGSVAGEIVTFSAGPNNGVSAKVGVLLGGNGGLPGSASGPCPSFRAATTCLTVGGRWSNGSAIEYEVELDRIGLGSPVSVADEDCSDQFYL